MSASDDVVKPITLLNMSVRRLEKRMLNILDALLIRLSYRYIQWSHLNFPMYKSENEMEGEMDAHGYYPIHKHTVCQVNIPIHSSEK